MEFDCVSVEDCAAEVEEESKEEEEEKEAKEAAAVDAASGSGCASSSSPEQRSWNCTEQLKEVVEDYKMGKTNLRQVEIVFDEWKNRKDVKENASIKRVDSHRISFWPLPPCFFCLFVCLFVCFIINELHFIDQEIMLHLMNVHHKKNEKKDSPSIFRRLFSTKSLKG